MMRVAGSESVSRVLPDWIRRWIPNSWLNTIYHFPKAVLANLIEGFPAAKLDVIGITGTKGKTTTAHLLHHIISASGRRAVLISTLGAYFDTRKVDTGSHVTNPGPFLLQRLLSRAVQEGYKLVILEVTSQGLAQYRNWGIGFRLGLFTHIHADHLGYHGGIAPYRKAKARLIGQSKRILVNASDPAVEFLKSVAQQKHVPITVYRPRTRDVQSQNRAAAIAAASALGIPRNQAVAALQSFPGVSGRLEVVKDSPFTVVIDFAHTPESLSLALRELRNRVRKGGRLIAVFGCAGERDPGRRRMGAVAARLADFFIVTVEDPRTEGVEKISQEIASYAIEAGAVETTDTRVQPGHNRRVQFARIPDRQQAVSTAIKMARRGDVVGLFGKGHERSMCFGKTEVYWSEHEAVKQAFRKRGEP